MYKKIAVHWSSKKSIKLFLLQDNFIQCNEKSRDARDLFWYWCIKASKLIWKVRISFDKFFSDVSHINLNLFSLTYELKTKDCALCECYFNWLFIIIIINCMWSLINTLPCQNSRYTTYSSCNFLTLLKKVLVSSLRTKREDKIIVGGLMTFKFTRNIYTWYDK